MSGSKKITELTSLTVPASGDLLVIIDDPTGTPVTKKITVGNLLTAVNLAAVNSATVVLTTKLTVGNSTVNSVATPTSIVVSNNGVTGTLTSKSLDFKNGSNATFRTTANSSIPFEWVVNGTQIMYLEEEGSLNLNSRLHFSVSGQQYGSNSTSITTGNYQTIATLLDMTKQVQILHASDDTDNHYYLPDGMEGQQMFFCTRHSSYMQSITIWADNIRSFNSISPLQPGRWYPFNSPQRTLCMALFVDGAWNIDNDSTA